MTASGKWSGFDVSLLDSSVWSEPPEIVKVWITLLLMRDRGGFVRCSIPGLARRAHVSVEWTLKALEKFLSPDPMSSDPDFEGRKIKKVEGGWVILNHDKYAESMKEGVRRKREASFANSNQRNGATPTPCNGEGQEQAGKSKEKREIVKANINRETFSIRETLRNSVSQETWHTTERAAYASQSSESHREAFVIIRGWAEIASTKEEPEPDFPIATEPLGEELGLTPQGAGKIRRQFVDDGIIKQTAPYDYRAGQSARYRWALETTIPVPAMPEEQDDSDLAGNPF
jgi:hypothetical protein